MTNGGFEVVAKFLEAQGKDLKRKADQRAADKADAKEKLNAANEAMAKLRNAQQKVVSLSAEGATGAELQDARDAANMVVENTRAARAASEQAATKAAAAPLGSAPTGPWMGAAGLAIVIGAIAEYRLDHQPSPNTVTVVVKTCTAVMAQVDVLTEDELKKENQDVSIALPRTLPRTRSWVGGFTRGNLRRVQLLFERFKTASTSQQTDEGQGVLFGKISMPQQDPTKPLHGRKFCQRRQLCSLKAFVTAGAVPGCCPILVFAFLVAGTVGMLLRRA